MAKSIDEILLDLVHKGSMVPRGKTINTGYTAQAKQALYQRLLEVIGADEPTDFKDLVNLKEWELMILARNDLKTEQRKALAELMGVKE